jgi:CheY-like chemotaxis protein
VTSTASTVILTVDDDAEALALLGRRIQSIGYEALPAPGGQEALAIARARRPDLVITDVVMPGMDGFALARALRSDAALALIPIVFLTALEEPDDVLHGFNLGADDYLPKSNAALHLAETIDRVLVSRANLQSFVERRVRGAASFEGQLEHLGLASVLFLLESTAKTGTLRVKSGRSSATLYMREGSVIGAEIAGSGALRDEYVFYFASNWSKGTFAFTDGPVSGNDRVGKTTTELILEAARRQDEESAKGSS